jgi:hypothetical protein
MPLRPPASTKKAGAGIRVRVLPRTSPADRSSCRIGARRPRRRHVAGMVAVAVAAGRARRRRVALSPRGGGADGGAVVAAAAAGAALRAPRRARAGLPLLLRQLHRTHQAHGGRVLAPHDVLPRVLAFYRHWRNLYGKLTHHVKST